MYKTTLFLALTAGSLSAATAEPNSIPFLSKPSGVKTTTPLNKPPIASTPLTKTPPPCCGKEENQGSQKIPSCHSPEISQIGYGVTISGSYLLWRASENLAPYAQVVTTENIIDATRAIGSPRGHNESVNPRWSSGFNVRLGYTTSYDNWDLFADWTWYQNRTHTQISEQTNSSSKLHNGLSGTQNGLGIYNSYGKDWVSANVADVFSGLPSQIVTAGPFANASVHWNFNYDTFNLEFGKSFKTKANLLRPFFGLQGALFERTLSTSYTNYTNPGSLVSPSGEVAATPNFTLTGFQSAASKAKMNFWGIGPMVGVLDEFRFSYGWSLFGQLGTSMLYGRTHGYDQNSLTEILSNGQESVYDGVKWERHTAWTFGTHLQLRFGTGWSLCFNKQKSEFFLSAAWEQNFWFLTNYSSIYNNGNMNFSLGGLTATGGFNF